jgi:Zn-dependent peptidase ImmA (M78 family)/DNA-binding XRE family transcriptional regulator
MISIVTKPNRHRLILARESRGIQQQELNDRLGLGATTLSKIEHGDFTPSAEVLSRLAEETGYPLSFFTQPGMPPPTDYLAWRRREKVAQKLFRQISARVDVLRLVVQDITQSLRIPAPIFPFMQLSDTYTPADVAKTLRLQWGIPEEPIRDLTSLLESHGIPVAAFNFDTDRVDSRAVITVDRYPLICVNSNHTADRQRFSLAYQLGHLLMHLYTKVEDDQPVGHEANLFAAELLMPEAAIRRDIGDQQVTFNLLKNLKGKWRVSMIALLYRADDLGYLSENQKRYLIQQFNELKLRRREPIELDVPVEQPKLLRTWLTTLKRREKLNTAATAARLHLSTDEFITLFG